MKDPLQGLRKVIVILNGISLKKKLFYNEYLPAISSLYDVEVHETVSKNDASILASRFCNKNVDLILAAGGDGTLNQVVNGMMTAGKQEQNLPAVGVIPMGSGNDFARSIGVKLKIDHFIKTVSTFRTRDVDVGVVEYNRLPDGKGENSFSYFVNVADIGMGPAVVGKVLNSSRPFGGEVAYYQSILSTFVTYKPMAVKAVTPEWTWEGKIRTLAVANGKYYGSGLCIAPEAVIDDGMFAVFICGNVSVLDFIMHTSTLKKGESVMMDEVLYKSARQIDFSSESPCPIECDGEILGWLPAKVSMTGRQLKFVF